MTASNALSTRVTRPTHADADADADAAQASACSAAATPCLSLIGRVCDQVNEWSDAFEGHYALQHFVLPEYVDEARASVPPSRAQLGAMLRALNADVRRHIDALALATSVLQAQMRDGQAQTR
ncbi:hypothetical protein [Hydrogenophaga sp. BPS33]|uniref:hypothetical protein n=1 Tax=Hydrogenophaga sp. BPS33 TaxID=2651974 RepID=UPI00131F69DF|nr:hypothetical protein [Hydrogenophaga sp. BPS33]QHE86574.1 hypothetical protein F9K07_17565 [Hydrogenophaga sp. BPS33]